MLIRRTAPPVPVTGESIRRDRDSRLREAEEIAEDRRVAPETIRLYESLPYPPVLPPYKRTRVDSESNLWVQDFQVSGDGPNRWSVFDESGSWLGRVDLPDGLLVFEIGSDYVLGRTTDELEVEHVELFELIKN